MLSEMKLEKHSQVRSWKFSGPLNKCSSLLSSLCPTHTHTVYVLNWSGASTPLPNSESLGVCFCSPSLCYGLETLKTSDPKTHFVLGGRGGGIFILTSQGLVYFTAWCLDTWKVLFYVYCQIKHKCFRWEGKSKPITLFWS